MKSQKKISLNSRLFSFIKRYYVVITICTFFGLSYLLLSVIKHVHFLSGYDLSIIDQAIWKYSQFKIPITTTHVYFDQAIFTDHLELIFILISPLYWVFNSAITLIVLQVISVIASGIAIFLLAKKYKLKKFVSYILLINYYSFFGIQFAIWSDVHSLVLALGFLAWFVYFLEAQNLKLTVLFLLLSLICKEDIALLTFLIGISYLLIKRNKIALLATIISLIYLLFVFLFYFPVLMGGYKYAHPNGIFHDPNPIYLIDSPDKQKVFLYSLGSFGFTPILAPLYLLPFLGDLAHYFVLGNSIVTSSHGIFAHYRSSVALLLILPVIIAISKMKKYNNKAIGIYLLFCTLSFQYYLHLPLSYLSKQWFWATPPEVKSINHMIGVIPNNASLVTHNNLAAHMTHRDEIYNLFPSIKDFNTNSPCGTSSCKWFRVGGNPEYLLIDTGKTWNILHYLAHREDFFEAISNLEKNGNITLIEQRNTTKLYRINKKI